MEVTGDNLLTPEASNQIHGDILESIFNHVPLVDLVPASYVSMSWKLAVSASLQGGGRRRRANRTKPWLLIYTQSTRFPHSTTAHAYDPRSHVWIQIHEPSMKFISALRSSHSTLLYMLSPSSFSISHDPLHLTWHHIKAPLIWRTDPIVAMVGTRVIIAGGTCYFEDDPLAVEMYDLETCKWEMCEPMPSILKESAASTWLSIAVNSNKNKMYVVEKSTGVAYSFDPSIKKWQGPYNLRPDHTARTISCWFIGFSSDDRLIFGGVIGDDIESIKLWEVDGESLEVFREIGEMPKQLVEKMKAINSEDDAENMIYFGMPMPSSISMSLMDDFVYIYLSSTVGGAIIMCDISGDDSGACNWTSVKNTTVNDIDRCKLTQCTVTCCSKVGLDDLDKALSENRKFYVKETV
uniref:F-box domain-containing protein n=2 Tax=Salix viminalis TaxID=40686 RepID=A0A6N2N6F6_SALVM